MTEDIIVVGAGASGLMGARQLSEKGLNVLVLEAETRIGGRIHSYIDPSFPAVLELGAEFVHGNLPLTLGILDEAGIRYEKDDDSFIRIRNGKWSRTSDFIEGWEEMLTKMKSVVVDMSLRSFLDLNYKADQHLLLRNEVTRYAEGFDLADPDKVSVRFLCKEWQEDHHDQYRIPEGYRKLVDFLAGRIRDNGGRIITGTIVDEIDWKKNQVKVITRNGKIFQAKKIIITVPLGVMQQVDSSEKPSMRFNPSISLLKEHANHIGFGSVVKYFALFDNFFSKELSESSMILGDKKIPTWWVRFFKDKVLLTGWLGGPAALQNIGKSQSEHRDLALDSIAQMFNVSKPELEKKLRAVRTINWSEQPFSVGAYSYDMVGSPDIKKILRQPLASTVYFAGEGLYEGTAPGTVEAALSSGREVANRLLINWPVNKA